MQRFLRIAALPLLLIPSACVVGTVAKTAVDVATMPVKAVSYGVDKMTTSQSEADQNRGRQIRKQEEEAGRQARAMDARCRSGRPLPTDSCYSNQPR